MLGKRHFSTGSAAAFMALALAATACNPDSATTGPSGLVSKDFAANLRLVSGDQQSGPLAAALGLPIVVRVVDAGGQPVSGATVTFSVRAGGGSVNPAANVSGADGTVTANWTMGTTLGANKVVALLTNQFLLDSATFTATATVGPPKKFTYISGDSQTFPASRKLPTPIVVLVQDDFGNNLSGTKVTWQVPAGSGAIVPTSDTTGADGKSSAFWTLGTAATTQFSFATVTGINTLNFRATATPDTGRTFTAVGATNKGTLLQGTSAGTLTLKVTDQWGNNITGAGVIWNDSLTSGGTVANLTGTTSAAGTVTTTWTLGRRAGAQLVRAKLAGAGRTETVTYTATANVELADMNVGNYSSCALGTDGTTFCWGYGADGQLGKGANLKNVNGVSTAISTADTLAGPFLTFRQMSVGKNHACGVTIGRDLYCWGANNISQIGPVPAGGTPGKWLATQVWASVSAGEFNTCAITPTGALYCSGANDQAQMGNGAAVPAGGAAPALAALAGAGAGKLWSTVAVGQSHVCAMERFDPANPVTSRTPWCWGYNTSGQVGGGTLAPPSVPPKVSAQIVDFGPTGANLAVGTVFDSTSLVSGNAHSCVLTTLGAAYCWGNNAFGQLGNNAPLVNSMTSTPVAVAGGLAFTQLTAGAFHTCGLAGGVAYCWGRNSSGQLGDGNVAGAVNNPVVVGGGLTFRNLSAGELFTCGVVNVGAAGAGTTSGRGDIYCWGDNEYGQLGITNNFGLNNMPVLVPTKIQFTP
jgi:alpha-tubulin suppressor-like RCC1 family protein